jgi:hypothetical protein
MSRYIAIAAFLSVFAVAPSSAQAMSAADVERCQMMAATLTPKKAEMEKLIVRRDALAEEIDLMGADWEDDEALRVASSGHADAADQSKARYDEAKSALMQLERGLQASSRQFNRDVADYNRSCATD